MVDLHTTRRKGTASLPPFARLQSRVQIIMKNVRLSPGRWRAACYWMVTPCWGTRLRSPWLWMFLPSHGLSSQPCGRPLLRRIFTDCAARLHHSLAILAWSLLPPCSTLAEHALRACRSRMELPALLRLSGRRGIKLRLTLGGSAGSYPRPGTCHMTKWVTYFSNWISWCPWVMARTRARLLLSHQRCWRSAVSLTLLDAFLQL